MTNLGALGGLPGPWWVCLHCEVEYRGVQVCFVCGEAGVDRVVGAEDPGWPRLHQSTAMTEAVRGRLR